MAATADARALISNQLAELVLREVGQTGAPLTSDSKFASYTISPLAAAISGAYLIAGVFLTGEMLPLGISRQCGYWVNNPRKLWLMVLKPSTATGAVDSNMSLQSFGLRGAILAEAGTGKSYRCVSRQAHWVPVAASGARGDFPAAICTTIDVVEVYTRTADYGTSPATTDQNYTPQGKVFTIVRDNKLDATGAAATYVDWLSTRAATSTPPAPLLGMRGELQVGFVAPSSFIYMPQSNVMAGASALGVTPHPSRLIGSAQLRRSDFQVSVASARAGSESEGAAMQRVATAASKLTRFISALVRGNTDRSSPGSLVGLSVSSSEMPEQLEGLGDAWCCKIQVSATDTEG